MEVQGQDLQGPGSGHLLKFCTQDTCLPHPSPALTLRWLQVQTCLQFYPPENIFKLLLQWLHRAYRLKFKGNRSRSSTMDFNPAVAQAQAPEGPQMLEVGIHTPSDFRASGAQALSSSYQIGWDDVFVSPTTLISSLCTQCRPWLFNNPKVHEEKAWSMLNYNCYQAQK